MAVGKDGRVGDPGMQRISFPRHQLVEGNLPLRLAVEDRDGPAQSWLREPPEGAEERIDRVGWDSINEVTLDLFDLAQEFGGEYDGWEATIEKGT